MLPDGVTRGRPIRINVTAPEFVVRPALAEQLLQELRETESAHGKYANKFGRTHHDELQMHYYHGKMVGLRLAIIKIERAMGVKIL